MRQRRRRFASRSTSSVRRSDSAIFRVEIRNEQMTTIAVIGLGYVGLPLAVEFGKR